MLVCKQMRRQGITLSYLVAQHDLRQLGGLVDIVKTLLQLHARVKLCSLAAVMSKLQQATPLNTHPDPLDLQSLARE